MFPKTVKKKKNKNLSSYFLAIVATMKKCVQEKRRHSFLFIYLFFVIMNKGTLL